jgi:hypothetical protein
MPKVDMDKLFYDMVNELEPVKESVSPEFSTGNVSKLRGIEEIKAAKKKGNDHSAMDSHRAVAQNQDFAPASEAATPMTSAAILANTCNDAETIKEWLQTLDSEVVSKIAQLREAGKYEGAKVLREAHRAAGYAASDLKDACDLLAYLLK